MADENENQSVPADDAPNPWASTDYARSLFTTSIGKMLPCFHVNDIIYRLKTHVVITSYRALTFPIGYALSDFKNLPSGKLRITMLLSSIRGSVANPVRTEIFGASTPAKIVDRRIKSPTRPMSSFCAFGLWFPKSFEYQEVYRPSCRLVLPTEHDSRIVTRSFRNRWLQYLSGEQARRPIDSGNVASKATHSPLVANLVQAFVSDDRQPSFGIIDHSAAPFCVRPGHCSGQRDRAVCLHYKRSFQI